MGPFSMPWCKHYHGMSGQEQCGAGVRFDSLTNYGTRQFRVSCPCFGANGMVCEKADYPTVAEMVERERAMLAELDNVDKARRSSSRVKTMILFANGNIAAFNEDGKQIAELQRKSSVQLWAEFATRLGYDVEGCECRMQAPGGTGLQVVLDPVGVGEWKMSPIV